MVDDLISVEQDIEQSSVSNSSYDEFTLKTYRSEGVCSFFDSFDGNELMKNLDRSHPALMMSPWFIRSIVDARSHMFVVEQSGKAVGYFLFTLEHRFGTDVCYAHRYDLFPESIDVRCVTDVSRENVTKLVIEALKDKKYVIDIDGIRKDSIFLRVACEVFSFTRIEQSPSGRFLVEFDPLEEFLAKSSRKFRGSINNCRNSLKKLGVYHEVFFEYDESILEVMFELHNEVFGDKSELVNNINTYKKLIYDAFENKSAFIIAFFDGEKPIAINFMLIDNGIYYGMNGGRSTNSKYSGVGKLIMIYEVITAFEIGAKAVYAMRPDTKIKQQLGGEEIKYVRLRCASSQLSWWRYRLQQEVTNFFTKRSRAKR